MIKFCTHIRCWKDSVLSISFALYFLSLMIMEYSILPNRILMGLWLALSLYLFKNKIKVSLISLIPLSILLLTLFFTVFHQCSTKLLLLHILIPITFLLSFPVSLYKSHIHDFFKGLTIASGITFLILILDRLIFLYNNFLGAKGLTGDGNQQEIIWWNEITHKAFLGLLKIHPSYLSMFLLSGFSYYLIILLEGKSNSDSTKPTLRVLFYGIFLILIASKMALIIILVLTITLLFWYRSNLNNAKLTGLFITLIAGGLLIINVPSISYRVSRDLSLFKKSEFRVDNTSRASERIFLWKSALEIINTSPMGQFCQDSKDLISQANEKKVAVDMEKKNAHNNFLEYGISFGYIGILLLLGVVLSIGFVAISFKSSLLYSFILIFFMFSLVESTLVRELGVLYFGLFSNLGLLQIQNKNK